MGRPTKYSDWRAGAICAHLRSGATRTAAVAAAGVSYDAFRRWQKSNAEFASAVMQAEAECAVAMSKVIFDAAMAGDWRASLWWLERRRPYEWGRRPPADPEIEAAINALLEDLFSPALHDEA